MKTRSSFLGVLLGIIGTGWACSSPPDSPAPEQAAAGAPDEQGVDAQAGAGGGSQSDASADVEAGAGGGDVAPATAAGNGGGAGGEGPGSSEGKPCKTDRDCDDRKACNGLEACVDDVCEAGTAIECAVNLACSDAADGTCIFADSSPWVVYQADDDTPGLQEIYAVKRDLAGKMEPIKLNDPAEPGWQNYGGEWTPDPQLYMFAAQREAPFAVSFEFVYFDEQGPGKPLSIEGDSDYQWSPSGRYLYIAQPHGISIYENEGHGKLTRVIHEADSSYETFSARWAWAAKDQIFYSVTVAGLSSIFRAAADKTGWKVSPIAYDIKDLDTFDPSPDGATITYDIRMADGKPSVFYTMGSELGSARNVLCMRGGPHSLSWSADASRFLLIRPFGNKGQGAMVGSGNPYYDQYERVASEETIIGGVLSPDGSQVILTEPLEDWGVDWRILDASGVSTIRSLAQEPTFSGGPRWAGDGQTAVMQTLASKDANIALSLVSLSGRASETLDSVPAGQRFEQYEITPSGEFVAYTKGKSPSLDGAYVDLRYANGHKPVRLPGEGTLWSLRFDDSGQGLYYIREATTGARQCFYLDLSRQVAAPPVKIGREGRVDVCAPQASGE